jgi:di/tripeptidase
LQESDNSADAKYETEEYLELNGVRDFRKWLKGFKLDKERIKEVVEEVAEEMRKAEVGLETDRVYVCTIWDGTDVYVKVGR